MPLRALLDLLFPPLCHVCKEFIPAAGSVRICATCLSKITFLASPHCPICGIPFANQEGSDHLCGSCHAPRPFTACRAATLFDGPISGLIHRFKYGGQVHLSSPLGILTARALEPFFREAAPELILPVPLHRKRLRQRGYNQSQLLAKVLEKQWGVPMQLANLRRVRWTEPQTTLTAKERGRNVSGAFQVRDSSQVKGRRVLLVDDVLTTGSTVCACAEALREAGADAVFVATVARGITP